MFIKNYIYTYIFNFILTIHYYSIYQENNIEKEEDGNDQEENINNIPKLIEPRYQKLLKKPPAKFEKYDILPFIITVINKLHSDYFWEKLRPNGIFLGLVMSTIIKDFVEFKYPNINNSDPDKPVEPIEPIKPIILHAFDTGICSELAETLTLYREMKPNNYPPLLIQGFSMY